MKVESLPNAGGECLLIRDQTQGFYAGDNDSDGRDDRVVRTCVFSKDKTHRVLDFAVAEARRRFGDDFGPIVMAYKFHLLDLRFAHWVEDYARTSGLDVRVFQPDTMNRHLLKGTFRGNFVVVGGNEWGDIMHADILARAGLGNQDERCSHNVYLDPTLAPDGVPLVELQTVHGSADDIAEQDRVNPTATLRAAARILEDHAGLAGLVARVEHALASAAADGFLTPDVGGKAGSRAVAEAVIARTVELLRAPDRRRATADTALVIVDMQRDFCAPDGRFAALGLIDPARTAALEAPLAAAIAHARGAGLPVVFVRTHADAELLPARVAERHAKAGRAGYLRAGTPGAEPFGVRPAPGDVIITKSGYDAFFGTELEALLARRGITRVIVAGVFADLCVDALARGAFLRGLGVTVLADATLALERDVDQVLGFMRRFYDVDVVTSAELAAGGAAADGHATRA